MKINHQLVDNMVRQVNEDSEAFSNTYKNEKMRKRSSYDVDFLSKDGIIDLLQNSNEYSFESGSDTFLITYTTECGLDLRELLDEMHKIFVLEAELLDSLKVVKEKILNLNKEVSAFQTKHRNLR